MRKNLKKALLTLLAVTAMAVIFCFGVGALEYGDYEYKVLEDGNVEITDYMGDVSTLVIPDKIDGKSVTTIGEDAFNNCYSITSVTIPNSVTSISEDTFCDCINLQSLTVDEKNRYYSSDECGVLFNKNKTEIIQYPVGNTRTVYTIPDSVIYIGDDAFNGCISMVYVEIPDSVTNIGNGAFYGCRNLESVYIPESVTEIGRWALGYFLVFDADGAGIQPYEPFEIKGVKNSAAEKYANDNGLKFVEYNPHTHSYTSKTTKSATCTATGVKTYTCSCGDSYTKTIAKLGHKYSSTYTVDKKATCTAEGSKSKHCTRCSAKTSVTAIAKLAHTYSEYVYNNDATYVADGTKTAKCKSCSAVNTVTAEGTKLTLATTSKVSSTKTTTSATLKWNAVEGATGYRVFQKVDGRWKKLTDTTKLTYTVKNLKAGIKYNFAVRAYVLDDSTKVMAPKYKSLAVTTSSSAKPAQVKNVKATPTATTVKLTWSKISGVKGYEIFSYNSKTKKYTSLGKTTGTTFTVKKLKANTAYQYAVQAYTVSGKKTVYGKVSSVVKVTTLLATPTVKITSTKGKANLTWNNIAGESGYAIYMATSKSGKYTHLANYKANSTKATKSKLKSGKTYYFKIRAYKKASGKTTYSAYSAVKSVKIK